MAYSVDSQWRNRDVFVNGREQIVEFLAGKWDKERDYRLAKQLWAFTDNRIAVRFQYEYHDEAGNWFRAYGNENWDFDDDGLMRRREASVNDYAIKASERKFHWAQGPRPVGDPGLGEFVK